MAKVKFNYDGLNDEQKKAVKVIEESMTEIETLSKDEAEKVITQKLKEAGIEAEFMGTLKGELDENKKGSIKSILLEQGKAITDLNQRLEGGINVDGLDEFQKEFEAAKKELKEIRENKSGSKQFNIGFTNKAAAITTTTSSITNSYTTQSIWAPVGVVNEIQRLRPFVLDFVNVGTDNGPMKIWWDELPKEGDFAVTAEGAVKPMVQYKFERRGQTARKVAGYTVITDEFEMDYPSLVSKIKSLMRIDCRNKIGSVVMTDLVANASAYSITALNAQIDNADRWAAIAAAAAQLASLGYSPTVLGLNPFDAVIMGLGKDTTGQYIGVPKLVTDLGLRIIEAPDVAAGKFFLGDPSVYWVDMKGGVIVKVGYVNDDLIKNQYTVVVEQFFYNGISTARKAGLIYGDFATIITAIEKP